LIIGRNKTEAFQKRDSRLYHKLGEVNLKTNSGVRILGHDDKQCINESLVTCGKGTETDKSVHLDLKNRETKFKIFSQFDRKLYSTLPAISTAPLQIRSLQKDLIVTQRRKMTYEQELTLSKEAMIELRWWINNLTLSKGCPVRLWNPDMIIYSDVPSKQGWRGAPMEGGPSTGGG